MNRMQTCRHCRTKPSHLCRIGLLVLAALLLAATSTRARAMESGTVNGVTISTDEWNYYFNNAVEVRMGIDHAQLKLMNSEYDFENRGVSISFVVVMPNWQIYSIAPDGTDEDGRALYSFQGGIKPYLKSWKSHDIAENTPMWNCPLSSYLPVGTYTWLVLVSEANKEPADPEHWLGWAWWECSLNGGPPPASELYTVPLELPEGATPMQMKMIPSGTFLMGSSGADPDAYSYEKPQHMVKISKSFYMGMYEVTQAQWAAVMGSVPEQHVRVAGENKPVFDVSWNDIQAFLEVLNSRLDSAPQGYRFALPTEAQREYCCRAGTTSIYSFGDSTDALGEYGWYYRNSRGLAQEVGMKKPNPWGLYDMHGNAMEWCRDTFTFSGYSNLVDPNGPAVDPVYLSGGKRVVRDGHYDGPEAFCRSAKRSGMDPDTRNRYLGFRIVMEPVDWLP